MENRNKISLILIGLILIGGLVATLVTIRDYNKIIDDFGNFTGITVPNGGTSNNKGDLLLYIVANTTTNQIGMTLQGPVQKNIEHAYITVNEFKLKQKGTQHYEKVFSDETIDLKNFEDITLFDNISLSEGSYTYLSIRFSQNIKVVTTDGNYTFELQGNSEIQIPFYKEYKKSGQHMQGELCMKPKVNVPLLVEIVLNLNWFSQRAVIRVAAFLSF
ncbi:MAG: hypothetical protein DRI86_15300 [Bacteroidetes bacterium]|nr:MAG: hypothetical protein DRI86_15300 [Bacteroidota bacterium]